MKPYAFWIFFCCIIYAHPSWSQELKGSYKVIYEADRDGNRLSGDLETLIDFVRSGNPIRVGWELPFRSQIDSTNYVLEHWSDAGFISLHQNHVFAQIPSIYGQGSSAIEPNTKIPSIFLSNNKPHGWVAVIGTTGMVRQKMLRDEEMVAWMKKDGMTDAEIDAMFKKMEISKYKTKWAVAVQD